jgi:hypothetical protein
MAALRRSRSAVRMRIDHNGAGGARRCSDHACYVVIHANDNTGWGMAWLEVQRYDFRVEITHIGLSKSVAAKYLVAEAGKLEAWPGPAIQQP